MTLGAVVAEAARRFGGRRALVAVDRYAVTYEQLDRLSDVVTGGLQQRGIGIGDVVALLLPSSPEYVIAYVAAAKLGAITAGVNPRLAPPQRARLLEAAAPALVIGTDDLVSDCAEQFETVTVDLADAAENCLRALHRDDPSVPPDDPERDIAIVFTSGTSGDPKGAVFKQRHLDAIDRLDVGDAGWGSGGPMLMSTELVHVGAMTKLGWYVRLGMTIHLLPRWRAADALRVISNERIPSVGGIAPQIALLLRVPEFDDYDLSGVKTIVAGGAPSPPALVTEARERFGADYSIRYSSTESGGVGTATAFDAPDEEALHTVGRPRPEVDVAILDAEGNPVSDGVTGTVALRSPAVMDRYWGNDEATAATLKNGWLHTGDLGFVDGAGCLRLVGRAGDMFIRGGYNVAPETVEAVLSRHPLVAAVAVVPKPDAVLGEVGEAVVVARDPQQLPTLDDLRSYAADKLAHHELPEAIRLVDALPYTSLHKLDRAHLRGRHQPPAT